MQILLAAGLRIKNIWTECMDAETRVRAIFSLWRFATWWEKACDAMKQVMVAQCMLLPEFCGWSGRAGETDSPTATQSAAEFPSFGRLCERSCREHFHHRCAESQRRDLRTQRFSKLWDSRSASALAFVLGGQATRERQIHKLRIKVQKN